MSGVGVLIRLTKLDGTPIVLNADLIRYVEQLPDTYITLTSGDRMIVRETMEQVMDLAITYQQQKQLLPKNLRFLHSREIPS